jgi:hypothetical protein
VYAQQVPNEKNACQSTPISDVTVIKYNKNNNLILQLDGDTYVANLCKYDAEHNSLQ